MRRERKFTPTERNVMFAIKTNEVLSQEELITMADGNAEYLVSNIRKLLSEGFIYSLSDAGLLQFKYGCTNMDSNPTHEWRWDGKYIEGKLLPGAFGPLEIEWPDATTAEKLEHWLTHFRRKAWFTMGNETGDYRAV